MKKLGIILSIFFMIFPICLLGSCETATLEIIEGIKNIEINKEAVEIDELDIIAGDSVELTSVINDNLSAKLIWESSDESVATVKDGVVKGLKNGKAIITVKVEGMPFISDSIFLKVASKVHQIGRAHV